jgi:undecaprenyl diphosphate synthase
MEQENTIQCLGFIMDGNRRWAKEHDVHTYEGHKKGANTFIDIAKAIRDKQIPHAVFFAFSTENWGREEAEVSYLMDLFHTVLDDVETQLNDGSKRKVRLRIVGRREDFSTELQERITALEAKSAQFSEAHTTIWIALSYGGRAEIIAGVNQAIAAGEPVTEETFNQYLWTAQMPEPDMIIRTSGEQRISNFLTWKSVYSEFFFTKSLWPDFTGTELDAILLDYQNRQRRKGK